MPRFGMLSLPVINDGGHLMQPTGEQFATMLDQSIHFSPAWSSISATNDGHHTETDIQLKNGAPLPAPGERWWRDCYIGMIRASVLIDAYGRPTLDQQATLST
jgi:hypothetical protein